ncbi:uncharacterized protein LOC144440114 [Glandiceps talaboti]
MRKDRGKKHSKKGQHHDKKGGRRDRQAVSSNQPETSGQHANTSSASAVTPEKQTTAVELSVGQLENSEDIAHHRKFSRRKVESNWDRYEGLPDDTDHIQSRGRDLNTILNEAGAASTQFRFSDERDWEDEIATLQANDDILALDLNSLSSALRKIPLYKRLQIEIDVFPPAVIERFEKEATDSDSSVILGTHSIMKAKPDIELQTPMVKVQTKSDIKTPSTEFDKPQSSQLSEEKKEFLMSEIGKTLKCENAIIVDKVEEETGKTLKVDSDEDEDDLEMLLSLETPVELQTTAYKPDSENVSELAENKSKDRKETETEKRIETVAAKSASTEETSECLEDWLDSVLDD